MLPLLPRYVKTSPNVTQGISFLSVLKDTKKRNAKGAISSVQLTPSKRGKNMVAVSAINTKEWHGKMSSFTYYTYLTYMKSELEAQVTGVVAESHKYALPFTFLTPLIVHGEEILNLFIPYECYFKELLSITKSVTFTAIGFKSGAIVDIGRYITNHHPSKEPTAVSLTFDLAGEINFSPKLYLTEFRDLHKTRNKCTSYSERMKTLTDYIIRTKDLSCVILTYAIWVNNASQQIPKGRCEVIHTFVVPIFRENDSFWSSQFRTTYNPYNIDAALKNFDLKSSSTAEKVFLAQYIHAGGGFYNEESNNFQPAEISTPAQRSVNTPRETPSKGTKDTNISAEHSKLTAFQSAYNSLLYAPENILSTKSFEPTTAAEYVVLSTPCAPAKVLYKYLYLRETLTVSFLALPEKLQCSPYVVMAAVSFVGHTQYTKCLNHRGYNTIDLLSGQRARFVGHHLKVDPNFLSNGDQCPDYEVFELVTEQGSNPVVRTERFDKLSLVDEAENAPVFEDEGTFIEEPNDSENGSSTAPDSEKPATSTQQTTYRTYAGDGKTDNTIVADLQAQLEAKDRLITISAENMRTIELENQRLYEEIAGLQKKLGIPQTYERHDQGDSTFSEMNQVSLSQITSGLGTQREELLNDLDKEIQGLINMSRRRDNEITTLAAQIENGGDVDSLVKEYLKQNKELEDKLNSKEQELNAQKKTLDAERDANKKLQKLLNELKADDGNTNEAVLQKLRIQYENQLVNLKKENLEKVQGLHAEIQRLRATHETKMHEAKKHYEEERNKELRSLKRRAEEDFMAKLTEIKLKIKEALAPK